MIKETRQSEVVLKVNCLLEMVLGRLVARRVGFGLLGFGFCGGFRGW